MCVCSSPSHFLCPQPVPFGNQKVACSFVRLFVWLGSLFVSIFRIHLQEVPYDTCLPSSSLRHLVWSSLLPSSLLDVAWCHPLYGWAPLLCVCAPCLLYPFICPFPLRLHPVLALVHSAAMNIGVHLSFKIMDFSGSVSRNGIAGSYGTSLFSVS